MELAKPVRVTAQGLARLENELNYLLTVRRVEIAEVLHEAQDGGDTLDNTEYQSVRYEQLLLEMRISELQRLLSVVQLIEPVNGKGLARLGSTVVVEDDDGQPETYMIVGSTETDPGEGRISDECPLGQALLNHRAGDKIAVQTPDGAVYYRITAVS